MMEEKFDFLAIGELLADIISTETVSGLEQADAYQLYQGGSPANVAANLAFLGKKTALVSCVGDDGIGRRLVRSVESSGVDISYLQKSRHEPTSIVVVARSTGTPDFIAYRGADKELQPIGTDLIARSRIVHTTAFALSKEPARGHILDAFSVAAGRGKIISADWNFAPSIWNGEDGKDVFERLITFKPLLKLSLDDVGRFFGGNTSIEESKKLLDAYPCRLCVLTCGSEGVWWRSEEKEWDYAPALPVSEVVDTTGAGDAFWAGMLAAFLDGAGDKDCMTQALLLAAKKIARQGPLYR